MNFKLLNKLRETKYFNLICSITVVFIAFLQYFSIELSYLYLGQFFAVKLINKAAGVATILFFDILLILILKNIRTALNIGIGISTILSFVNHYVNLWHGSPFTFAELKNFKTAMSVASSYKLTLDIQIIAVIMLTLAEIIVVNVLFRKNFSKRKVSAISLALISAALFFCYFSPSPVIPKNAVGWKWYNSIVEYGYTPCLVQFTRRSFNAIPQPETYVESELKNFVENYTFSNDGNETPDIIFVLNETFYDLNQITDVNSDVNYLEYIQSIDNSITGYAVCPGAGGGTNSSEYELLTSNSLKIAPSITPFNIVELDGAYSLTGHLNNLGYTSISSHPDHEINYRRNVGYPALGFATSYFHPDFEDIEYYKDRHYPTDACVYRNSINWYEQMPESPRFMYILTIQNHGGYSYLDASDYLVHTQNDYGEHTSAVNEFNTCIKISDDGFKTLIDYYSKSDRKVILCMVGDHAPSFAPLIVDKDMSADEKEIALRSVPYIIWSNYIDLDSYDMPADRMSMIYLAPTILDIANVKTTAYYDYLLNLRNEVPVITSTGIYQSADGNIYHYDEMTDYTDILDTYFNLDYAIVKQKDFINSFAQ